MSNNNQNNFPPLEMLPLLAHAISGALDAAKEQLANLLKVENKPYVLDDDTVNRTIQSFTGQIKMIARERDTCVFWRKKNLTLEQAKDIAEMEADLIEMEKITQRILFLAEHYKGHTIDKILAMENDELALAFLGGKLYPLDESADTSSNMGSQHKPFSLPPEVTCQKEKIENKGKRYTFRHAAWGEIGRIDVVPHGRQSKITSYEVAGDPRDPLTGLRNNLFRTIAMEFNRALEKKYGQGRSAEHPPFDAKSDAKMVASKIMVCLTCNAPVAFLIFVQGAYTPDQLEDYARMMYSKTVALNLPTWVIGAEEELVPDKEGMTLILQIWPKRREAEKISSLIFEPMLHKLQSGHCK